MTGPVCGSDGVEMRTASAVVLTAMLAVQPICVFGDNVVFPPNPVGEKLYRTQLSTDMLPIAIIACVLLLGWLLHEVWRKVKKSPSDAGWYDI